MTQYAKNLCRVSSLLRQSIRLKGQIAATSALYVSGKHASKLPSVVVPELPDLETVSNANMKESVDRRGLATNLESLLNGVKYIEWIKDEITQLEDQRLVVAENFKDLNDEENRSEADNEMLEWYKEEAKVIKRKLKEQNRNLWELDEKLIPDLLKLPNIVHELTPDEKKIVFSSGEKPEFSFAPKSHLDLAGDDLQFTSNSHTSYYSVGPLAELEQNLLASIEGHLLNAEVSMISCPDFAKAVVIEGCGEVDFRDPKQVFSLRPTGDFTAPSDLQSMHLVGGASLPAMVSFLSKNIVINPSVLPESYFCMGRQYNPVPTEATNGLFSVQQSTVVHCLSHSADRQSMNDQLESFVHMAERFYEDLGLPFNVVYQPARNLNPAQSFSATFEMYSPSIGDYVTVGNIAAYEDYLSKRLMLKYEENGRLQDQFVVSGTFANVTRLIACIIENTQTANGRYALPGAS